MSCTFIFYSCNGGYPGVMHMFGRESGPDFAFGPRIRVYPEAMTYATIEILNWKNCGGGNTGDARTLVDAINRWASKKYPSELDHHQFLRVMWGNGAKCRHPDLPSDEKPAGDLIPLLGWKK